MQQFGKANIVAPYAPFITPLLFHFVGSNVISFCPHLIPNSFTTHFGNKIDVNFAPHLKQDGL